MTYRAAKWLFLVGTATSLVLFLGLTVDTQRQVRALTNADKIDAKVVAGKRVFEKYNCNDCHTMLGFGGYYAPDLTRVYWRLGDAVIRQVVAHPEGTFAAGSRKMPQLNLSAEELDALVHFFEWVSNIRNNDWPPQDRRWRPSPGARLTMDTGISDGGALFKTKACMSCHQLRGVGGTHGGALDHVGSKLSEADMERLLRNPRSFNPNATMPSLDLSDEEIDALAGFLAKQR